MVAVCLLKTNTWFLLICTTCLSCFVLQSHALVNVYWNSFVFVSGSCLWKMNAGHRHFYYRLTGFKASSTKLAPHPCIVVCMENAEILSCQEAPLDFVCLTFILWQAIGFVQLPKHSLVLLA